MYEGKVEYFQDNEELASKLYAGAGVTAASLGVVGSLLDGNPDMMTAFSALLAPVSGGIAASYWEKAQEEY